jgi:hypothetical protein
MITYVRENLSTDEYMLFLDLLVPEPEPEPEVVKPTKKKRKPRSRSARAAGMAKALNKNLSAQRQAVLDDTTEESEEPPQALRRCGKEDCNAWAVNPIHDSTMGYAGYHEFQPAQRAAAAGAGIQFADTGPLP